LRRSYQRLEQFTAGLMRHHDNSLPGRTSIEDAAVRSPANISSMPFRKTGSAFIRMTVL
jgi:hypothetical protein